MDILLIQKRTKLQCHAILLYSMNVNDLGTVCCILKHLNNHFISHSNEHDVIVDREALPTCLKKQFFWIFWNGVGGVWEKNGVNLLFWLPKSQ